MLAEQIHALSLEYRTKPVSSQLHQFILYLKNLHSFLRMILPETWISISLEWGKDQDLGNTGSR